MLLRNTKPEGRGGGSKEGSSDKDENIYVFESIVDALQTNYFLTGGDSYTSKICQIEYETLPEMNKTVSIRSCPLPYFVLTKESPLPWKWNIFPATLQVDCGETDKAWDQYVEDLQKELYVSRKREAEQSREDEISFLETRTKYLKEQKEAMTQHLSPKPRTPTKEDVEEDSA